MVQFVKLHHYRSYADLSSRYCEKYDLRHMLYSTYKPRPPLSEFVELFWLYDGYTQPHAKERIMPDGSMQIVVNLLED